MSKAMCTCDMSYRSMFVHPCCWPLDNTGKKDEALKRNRKRVKSQRLGFSSRPPSRRTYEEVNIINVNTCKNKFTDVCF
jgi:hypothetical protein